MRYEPSSEMATTFETSYGYALNECILCATESRRQVEEFLADFLDSLRGEFWTNIELVGDVWGLKKNN